MIFSFLLQIFGWYGFPDGRANEGVRREKVTGLSPSNLPTGKHIPSLLHLPAVVKLRSTGKPDELQKKGLRNGSPSRVERFVLRGQAKVLTYVTRGDVQAKGLSLVTIRGSLDGVLARQRILWAKRSRTILGEQRRTNWQGQRVGAGIEIGCLRFYGH